MTIVVELGKKHLIHPYDYPAISSLPLITQARINSVVIIIVDVVVLFHLGSESSFLSVRPAAALRAATDTGPAITRQWVIAQCW